MKSEKKQLPIEAIVYNANDHKKCMRITLHRNIIVTSFQRREIMANCGDGPFFFFFDDGRELIPFTYRMSQSIFCPEFYGVFDTIKEKDRTPFYIWFLMRCFDSADPKNILQDIYDSLDKT